MVGTNQGGGGSGGGSGGGGGGRRSGRGRGRRSINDGGRWRVDGDGPVGLALFMIAIVSWFGPSLCCLGVFTLAIGKLFCNCWQRTGIGGRRGRGLV